MCDTCGGHEAEKQALHEHEHAHGHGHDHGHSHSHADEHARQHAEGIAHDHPNSRAKTVRVEVGREAGSLLKANDRIAAQVREGMTQRGILLINITSAPGSGKTSLLQATLSGLEHGSAAVLVGDLETDRDAQRLRGLGAQVRQINTGKGCHLSAAQVAAGLDKMDLDGVEMVFVENVGNMACPSDYDLGEHGRVAILSLPEGDDKAAKYPGLFAAADVVLLNKVDLATVLPFKEDQLRQDLAQLNTRAPLIRVSAIGGQGVPQWIQWLQEQRAKLLGKVTTA